MQPGGLRCGESDWCRQGKMLPGGRKGGALLNDRALQLTTPAPRRAEARAPDFASFQKPSILVPVGCLFQTPAGAHLTHELYHPQLVQIVSGQFVGHR